MTTKEIQQLITYLSKSGLDEVNIETDELKLSIKRNSEMVAVPTTELHQQSAPQNPAANQHPPAAQTPPPTQAAAPADNPEQNQPQKNNYIEVPAPMIGTFYRSSSPDKPPFVEVGDSITKGQPVCIIEAMKLFNEIESEVSGKIVKILVEDASPVEYNQPLFLVEPA